MITALAGQKGGSGKTTTAVNLADEWSRRGARVLLVDADPQGSARTWGEVAAEAGREVPTVVAMGANMYRPDQLPALARTFDHVVIDCPPRHGEIQRAALMVADMVILPCGPSAVDAWALGESLDIVRQAQMIRPELRAAILITRKVANTRLGQTARDVLAESGLPIFATELGYRVTFQEAPAAGLGVTRYQPDSPAAREVGALLDELIAFMERPDAVDAAEAADRAAQAEHG